MTLLLVKNLKAHYSGDRMEDYVILVDKDDNPIGKEEKVKCHLPNGKLHRAFTALIFNGDGKLLLTKRSGGKMLWPKYWDGSIASHPREGEDYYQAAERRIPEEIGVSCKMVKINKFEYHVPYKDVGSENEICATMIGKVGIFEEMNELESSLVKEEISEIKWINPDELKKELEENMDEYCPWMVIALYFLAAIPDPSPIEKYVPYCRKWVSDDLKPVYENAIKHYIPDNNWRLVP